MIELFADYQYFPAITFYRSLSGVSYVVFDPYVDYRKLAFCNRCTIAGANGPIILSVPLQFGRDQKRMMKDVKISSAEAWQKRHWKSILSSYNRSPWFEFYRDDLEALFRKPFSFLIDWNYAGIEWTIRQLALEVGIGVAKEVGETEKPPNVELNLPNEPLENPIYYRQVFEERNGFIPGLSILDLLFCEGKNGSQRVLGL